ncbi:hypothetical protein VP01_8430g1 [Puccinia sorghi]|uniref:Uncharacterized protein n=1 Tax=Puccinia sorghi TaxID=27349 RepID=A0A0L6U9G3_9BASI|nr:hypothetical protein VP01_8430g1 [Puccinia sorghi]
MFGKTAAVCGDILAKKKVIGYTSHSANKFCLFCHAEKSQSPALKLSRRREKAETISSARNSQDAESHNKQKELLIETGVWWSELNWLAYWDPSLWPGLTYGPNKPTRLTVQSTTDIKPEDLSDYVSTNENEDRNILLNSHFGLLPPGVPHLPLNLGEADHGKLNASKWHSLFFFIIPLVICKIYIPNVAVGISTLPLSVSYFSLNH